MIKNKIVKKLVPQSYATDKSAIFYVFLCLYKHVYYRAQDTFRTFPSSTSTIPGYLKLWYIKSLYFMPQIRSEGLTFPAEGRPKLEK